MTTDDDNQRLQRIRVTMDQPWDPAAGETTVGFLLRLLDDANARLGGGSLPSADEAHPNVDNDTRQYGTDGPFRAWEDDHTALVHVLWDSGITSGSADKIADRIMWSRWLAAVRSRAAAVPTTPEAPTIQARNLGRERWKAGLR